MDVDGWLDFVDLLLLARNAPEEAADLLRDFAASSPVWQASFLYAQIVKHLGQLGEAAVAIDANSDQVELARTGSDVERIVADPGVLMAKLATEGKKAGLSFMLYMDTESGLSYDELTSGQRLDTNSQWLSQRLAERGVRASFHTTVGDDLEANVRAKLPEMKKIFVEADSDYDTSQDPDEAAG